MNFSGYISRKIILNAQWSSRSTRFPTWSRNLNTGAPEEYDLEMRSAQQPMNQRGGLLSRVLLPTVKAEG